MFGTLNDAEIEEVLHKHTIGRIGSHANGKTYVVPTSYVYDGKYIYCHTHEGMKINMMRQNPNICFEVDTAEHPGEWKSVVAWGEFEEVINENERSNALKIMFDKSIKFTVSKTLKLEVGANYPFAPDDMDKIHGIVFRLKLHEKTGRFELNDNTWSTIAG